MKSILPTALLVCAAPLTAQDSSSTAATPATTLPTVVVTDDAPTLTVPSLQAVEEVQKFTAGGVSVVDSETYKTGRASNLKDALDFAPGVFVQPRFGADESRISIRGSGIQRTFHGRGLKLLQDGVPLNLSDGGFDMQAVDPLSAQYIDVRRGANALQFGGTTLGGAINFVSPTGYDASPLQLRAEYGSFDSLRAQISSGGVFGPFDYYASLSESYTQGYRDHSEQNTQRFFSNFGYKISDEVETRLYLTYVHTESELPGEVSKSQLNTHPRWAARSGFMAMFDRIDSDWERNFDLFRIANQTTFQLTDESVLSVSGFYSHKRLDHPILFVIDQESHDLGLDVNFVSTADLFSRENRFTLGFSPSYGRTEDQRYRNVLGHRGDLFAHSIQESVNLDLYSENVHYLTDNLALAAGAQLSHSRRKNSDRFPVSAADPDNSDSQEWTAFSPKLGLIVDVTPEAQIFANVSRSFEPPSFGELSASATGGAGLVDLDAQTATTVELGTRGKTAGGRVSWDIALYHAWVENELMELTVAPGLTQTVNADKTRHAGLEFGMDIVVSESLFADSDSLTLRQNYLWSRFQFDGDKEFGDNEMPGVPEHYYRAELLYAHPSGFYAGPNVEWVMSGYNVDSANTLKADSYALLGFKIGYRTPKGVSFYIEGRNLTDETYAATTSVVGHATPTSALFLPGDGRSVFVGMEYKF